MLARTMRLPIAAAPAVAVAPVFLLFAVLKVYGNYPAASDENIYFYMSVRTAFNGALPYRDYFFPHPPLHVLIGAAVFWLAALVHGVLHGSLAAGVAAMTSGASWEAGGLALGVAKAIPAASTLVAGIFVYRAARRAGGVEAVLAAAAFLLASLVLRASSHFTGVAEAAACTAIGVACLLDGRDRLCGLAFAAGCLVAMYVAPAGAAVWLVLLAISPRRALRVALWTAVPLLAVHGLFALAAGEEYWRGLVLYHLEKPADVRGFADAFWPLVYRNGHLFAALPVALLAGVLDAMGLLGFARAEPLAPAGNRAERRRSARVRTDGSGAPAAASAGKPTGAASGKPAGASDGMTPGVSVLALRAALADLFSLARLRHDPRRQFLAVALAGAGVMLFFLSRLNPVFEFYFVMVFVFSAMLAGYVCGAIVRAGWLAAAALARRRPPWSFLAALAVLAAAVLGAEVASRSDGVRRSEVPDQVVGVALARTWRPAPRLGPIDGLVRSALWVDQEILGRRYASVTEYLWHESVVFDAPREAAAYVRAKTPPAATLFGDSYLAPLVALMSERRLALDEADTNPMRFASGITPPGEFVARMEREPPAVILADASIVARPEFADWIAARYAEVRMLEDPSYDEVALYRRQP